MKQFVYLALIGLFIACQSKTTENEAQEVSTDEVDELEGVWRIEEANLIDSLGQVSNMNAQRSLVIFTQGYYSFVWTFGSDPRNRPTENFNPTDTEKIEAYNTIVVNTGTYELTGSKLVTKPLAARSEEFVGGYANYEFRVEGDTLYLEFTDLVSVSNVSFNLGGIHNFRLFRVE